MSDSGAALKTEEGRVRGQRVLISQAPNINSAHILLNSASEKHLEG